MTPTPNIINRSAFRFDTSNPEIGDEGFVDATINGETRTLACRIGGENVIYTRLKGRYGTDPRWYTIVLNSEEGGQEYVMVDEPSAPDHLDVIEPTEIKFRELAQISFHELAQAEGGAA